MFSHSNIRLNRDQLHVPVNIVNIRKKLQSGDQITWAECLCWLFALNATCFDHLSDKLCVYEVWQRDWCVFECQYDIDSGHSHFLTSHDALMKQKRLLLNWCPPVNPLFSEISLTSFFLLRHPTCETIQDVLTPQKERLEEAEDIGMCLNGVKKSYCVFTMATAIRLQNAEDAQAYITACQL